MRLIDTVAIGCESDLVPHPSTSPVLRFDRTTSYYYEPMLTMIHGAFFTAQLLRDECGIEEPYAISILIHKVEKFKESDPETNFERIKWIVENSMPPKNGVVVSFYEVGMLKGVRTPTFPSYIWPMKKQWTGNGDYISFSRINKTADRYDGIKDAESALLAAIEEMGVEAREITYTTPIEEACDIMIDAKVHFAYVGGTYFLTGPLNVPARAYGRQAPYKPGAQSLTKVSRYGSGGPPDSITNYNIHTKRPEQIDLRHLINIGDEAPEVYINAMNEIEDAFSD